MRHKALKTPAPFLSMRMLLASAPVALRQNQFCGFDSLDIRRARSLSVFSAISRLRFSSSANAVAVDRSARTRFCSLDSCTRRGFSSSTKVLRWDNCIRWSASTASHFGKCPAAILPTEEQMRQLADGCTNNDEGPAADGRSSSLPPIGTDGVGRGSADSCCWPDRRSGIGLHRRMHGCCRPGCHG